MAVVTGRGSSIIYSRYNIIILTYSFFLSINTIYMSLNNQGLGLFSGLYHATSITQTFQAFLILICIFTLIINSFIHTNKYFFFIKSKGETIKTNTIENWKQFNKIAEYPLILLFIITGALFLIATSDLVSVFLSLELQSYGLYILSTIFRNNESATKGGLTYFLLGGLSSCFILLGASLLYTNSGTTNLDNIYVINNLSNIIMFNNDLLYWYTPSYINFSILIIIIGFLFKVSSAPFHFWSPDVYDAIPTKVTTFVAIIPKISLFIFIAELVHYTNNEFYLNINYNVLSALLISSLLCLVVGTVGGLYQFRIKRLLAYSTISHVGFILLALGINTIESSQAFLFYLMQYTVANLNVFIILVTIGFTIYNTLHLDLYNNKLIIEQDKLNSPIQVTQQLGSFYMNPTIALSFTITIFSFVGIPPLIGFFAKQMVLSSAINQGYVFIVIVAILTSVISAVYYLNIVNLLFFNKQFSEIRHFKRLLLKKREIQHNSIISEYYTTGISILTLIILLFIFTPDYLLSIANILALMMFKP